MNREEYLAAVDSLKRLFEGPHITFESPEAVLELIEEVRKYRKEKYGKKEYRKEHPEE